jgi:hypothetical protein
MYEVWILKGKNSPRPIGEYRTLEQAINVYHKGIESYQVPFSIRLPNGAWYTPKDKIDA